MRGEPTQATHTDHTSHQLPRRPPQTATPAAFPHARVPPLQSSLQRRAITMEAQMREDEALAHMLPRGDGSRAPGDSLLHASRMPQRPRPAHVSLAPAVRSHADAAEKRQQWLAQLNIGDCIDYRDKHSSWRVSQIIGASATHFRIHPLYWSARHLDEDVERASGRLQPLCSQTGGQYTGSPGLQKYAIMAPTLPFLQAIPLHEHPLQRFRFEGGYICDGCQQHNDLKKPCNFYTCILCDHGFCTKCFLAVGGVDLHPLPCEAPPAKRIKLENLQSVEFVDDVKEYDCAVCLSVAHKPVALPGCGHLFCSSCLSKLDPNKCPTCRKMFDPAALPICLFAERQIAAKTVRCLNQAAGCEWTGELGQDANGLSKHLQACEHRTFPCPRCNVDITPIGAQKHAGEECLIRDPLAPGGRENPSKKRKH